MSWASEKADPVPGLDHGSVCWEEWRGAIHVLLWSNYPAVETMSERNAQFIRYGGTFTRDADPARPGLQVDPDYKIDFSLQGTAPEAGTLTVGGQSFDLAKGRVFLLAGKPGRVRVKQLDRDPSAVPVGQKNLEAFGRGEPEIATFFLGDKD